MDSITLETSEVNRLRQENAEYRVEIADLYRQILELAIQNAELDRKLSNIRRAHQHQYAQRRNAEGI